MMGVADSQSLAVPGTVMGTCAYMPPEQLRGSEVRLECHDPIGTFRHPSLSVNSRAAKHQMTSRLLAQYPGVR